MKPVSIVVAAAGVALVAGIVWALGPGARWVLEHVDGVAIGGPTGLAGKDLAGALDAVRGRVLAVATGLAALVAVYYTARNADTARRMFQLGEHGHVTDRYGKAVEQLGNAQAPVRLGGLHALEQLAQDAPGLRQTIVDVICAYLRMPYTPPSNQKGQAEPADSSAADNGVSSPASRDPHEERQVRLTAQRILTAHLRYQKPPARRWWQFRTPDANDRHWPGIRLDLTGAALMDFDLSDCRVGDAVFGGASFTGLARFVGVTFTGLARFEDASFTGGAVFGGASFTGLARFYGASFTGGAVFAGATFTGGAGFVGVTFTGLARFEDASFTGGAGFDGASFTGDAWFNRATFNGRVNFARATGLEWALLDGARVVPHEEAVTRWWVWPSCWQVVDGVDGWQTLRLAVSGEEGSGQGAGG